LDLAREIVLPAFLDTNAVRNSGDETRFFQWIVVAA
jgi:hypothetical protein